MRSCGTTRCGGCTGFTSQFTRLDFLDNYDARFVIVTNGPIEEALAYREKVGNKNGPKVDIAVDPLEGTTLCAKNMPGAIATLAMADEGTLLHAAHAFQQATDWHRRVPPGY